MKSLFSCFPRKKLKLKTPNNSNNQLVTETKSNDLNHCSTEIIKEEIKSKENNLNNENNLNKESNQNKENGINKENNLNKECQIKENSLNKENNINKENDLIKAEEKLKIEEKVKELLNERLRNALYRIENVYSVLNNKNTMYSLPLVISDFNKLINSELNIFLTQSECIGYNFVQKSLFIAELFDIQSQLLVKINNRQYSDIDRLNSNFKDSVIQLNRFCGRDDENSELNRVIADSIMVFGWICCFNNPSKFVQNVLDGSIMTVARFVNDSRYNKYSAWLKSWSVVLKTFCRIVTNHFQAGLMWRLQGPVPMDIIKCLVQFNYSNLKEESTPVSIKPKIVHTTAVDDISYETVTSLFDDLRSGKQKLRLKSVKTVQYETDEPSFTTLALKEQSTEVQESSSILIVEQEEGPCKFQNNTWIIANQDNNHDIEVTNKEKVNSVLISNCNDCSIQLDGRVESLKIENCANINVLIDEVFGVFLVVESSGIECQVLGTVQNVDLRGVSKFRLFLSKEVSEKLELFTHKCGDVDLFVSNNDEGGLELEDYDKHTVSTCCRTEISNGSLKHVLH